MQTLTVKNGVLIFPGKVCFADADALVAFLRKQGDVQSISWSLLLAAATRIDPPEDRLSGWITIAYWLGLQRGIEKDIIPHLLPISILQSGSFVLDISAIESMGFEEGRARTENDVLRARAWWQAKSA